MELITKADLSFINDLTKRDYTGNSLLSNATDEERIRLVKSIKPKLKELANYFADKYKLDYGPFNVCVSEGNPLKRADKTGIGKLNRIWSGIYKGAANKQYAAQISFVMNPFEPCLDVGFYFGSASSAAPMRSDEKKELESTLNSLGISLSNAIIKDPQIQYRYNQLFEFGFSAYSYANAERVNESDWYNMIRRDTKNSHIIAKIYPNDLGVIDNSTIDAYVAQVIFLMAAINSEIKNTIVSPLTPEQRAKQAERYAQIGQKGELYVLNQERQKVHMLHPRLKQQYPKHVAQVSDSYGYDILSIDENANEILIEVKTTTRRKDDYGAKAFFISSNEYEMFKCNTNKYKLYRVYDIEGDPYFEILNMEDLKLCTEGYIAKY